MWVFLGLTDKNPITTTEPRLESDLFLILVPDWKQSFRRSRSFMVSR